MDVDFVGCIGILVFIIYQHLALTVPTIHPPTTYYSSLLYSSVSYKTSHGSVVHIGYI